MSISSITKQSIIAQLGYLNTDQSQDVSDASSLSSNLSSNGNSESSSSSSTSATDISKVGYILSSLAKLEKSDPDEFKARASELASDFNDAADQCSDTMQSLSFKAMAAQFSNAATTGSMSSISLTTATNTLLGSYTSQSSLSLLDCLNGSQGTDIADQMSTIMNARISAITGAAK